MYETKAREISDALIRGENPELVTEGYENFDVDDWLKIGELIINVGVKKIKKTAALLQKAGLQLPGVLVRSNGYIHSIRDNDSNVKPRFENVTESSQIYAL